MASPGHQHEQKRRGNQTVILGRELVISRGRENPSSRRKVFTENKLKLHIATGDSVIKKRQIPVRV
jgi:hypothetical protein